MGKGACQRRRAANAERANWGNLHKVAKGKASLHMPLPPPPKDSDWVEGKAPASLRKMLNLKRHVESRPRHNRAANASNPGSAKPSATDIAAGGLDTAGRAVVTEEAQGAVDAAPQFAPRSGLDTGPVGEAASLYKDPQERKGMKPKKKEFLKQRALKRKAKASGAAAGGQQQLAGQYTPLTSFGDAPAPAPLQVQLKRKNHVAKTAQAQGERCKAIFLKQLSQVQQQTTSSIAAAQRRPSSAGSDAKAAAASQQGQAGLRQAQQREAMRQQYVDAYRAQRSAKRPGAGQANLASLAKLSKVAAS